MSDRLLFAVDRFLSSYGAKRCFYCGVKLVAVKHNRSPDQPDHKTWDHIMPRSKGGMDLVPCCYGCNSAKGCKTYNQFRLEHGPFYHETMFADWDRAEIPARKRMEEKKL